MSIKEVDKCPKCGNIDADAFDFTSQGLWGTPGCYMAYVCLDCDYVFSKEEMKRFKEG